MSEAKKSGSDGFDWTPFMIPIGGALVVVVFHGLNGGDVINPPLTTMVAVAALAEGVYMLFTKTLIAKLLTAALAGLLAYLVTGTDILGALVGIGLIAALMLVRFFQKEEGHKPESHGEEHKPAQANGGTAGGMEFVARVSGAGGMTMDDLFAAWDNIDEPETHEAIAWEIKRRVKTEAAQHGWIPERIRHEMERQQAEEDALNAARQDNSLPMRILRALTGGIRRV